MLRIFFFKSGLFGKAKKKILGEKDGVEEGSPSSLQSSVYKSPATGTISGYDSTMWEPQELGERERERVFWLDFKCLTESTISL